MSPRAQWPPFLNGKSLEPPRLLELAARSNWAIGEGPWSGRWPRTRWSLWQSSRVPLWRWEIGESGLYGRMTRRKPLLSKKAHGSTLGVCQKASKDSQTMRNKILWSDETKIELFGLNAKRHVWRKPGTIPMVKHGGGSLMLWETNPNPHTGGESSPSNRTMTLSTQPRQRRSVFGKSLWMSLNGPARARTRTRSKISGETWK
jgi:hypothetical protein